MAKRPNSEKTPDGAPPGVDHSRQSDPREPDGAFRILTNRAFLIGLALVMVSGAAALRKLSRERPGSGDPTSSVREYANALVDSQLYDAAAAEYEKLLAAPELDATQRANLSLLIANLYKDEAHDYAKALTYYLRVKHLYPKSKLADQVGPQIVECLERLGRSLDAKLELESQTKLDSGKARSGGPEGKAVVARIGKREITWEDLEKEIKKLPDYLREQFEEPGRKLEFLQQYLATELLYDKAQRLNLDEDPEIVDNAFQVKKSMMVQKLLDQEVRSAVKIAPEDVRLYYDAHRDRYRKTAGGKDVGQRTLLEARQEVEADLRREREQEQQQKLLQQLLEAEDVQVYSDLFPGASKLKAKGLKAK